MPTTGTPAGERLSDIIKAMVHGGINACRQLSRGLIITYLTPEPDTPRELQRWSLTAARLHVWPDDQELKIVYGCLYKAWRSHPSNIIFAEDSYWHQEKQTLSGGRMAGTYTRRWRQWPIREMFNAPPALLELLRAALARR